MPTRPGGAIRLFEVKEATNHTQRHDGGDEQAADHFSLFAGLQNRRCVRGAIGVIDQAGIAQRSIGSTRAGPRTAADVTPASPAVTADDHATPLNPLDSVVSLTVASWNQVAGWLRRLERLRRAG